MKLTKKVKNLIILTTFGTITLGSALSTIFYINKNAQSNNPDEKEETLLPEQIVKNKLFENLTAADLNINNLNVDATGVLSKTDTLHFTFDGGVNYRAYMEEETSYHDTLNNLDTKPNADSTNPSKSDETSIKFGGNASILIEDPSLDEDTVNLNESFRIYNPGDKTIYIDWNDTGYKISGSFITSTLKGASLFLDEDKKDDLNELIDKIENIDLVNLLPMIGTIGGSLVSKFDKDDSTNTYTYTIEVPGSIFDSSFDDTLTLNLVSNEDGELLSTSLETFSFTLNDKETTISMSCDDIQMVGINSSNKDSLDGFESGIIEGTSLNDYYANDLDSTSNLMSTIAKLMDEKTFKANYSLTFNEYQYDDVKTLGSINDSSTHSFDGEIAIDVRDSNNNYAFSVNKSSSFNNTFDVKYIDQSDENYSNGLFLFLNNNKGYMNDASLDDLFTSVDEILKDKETGKAFDMADEILNGSVIKAIMNGNYHQYEKFINKIFVTEGASSTTLEVSFSLKAMELNLPIEFEDVYSTIKINFDNSDDFENNLINYVEINNIPLKKLTRLNENNEEITYLDLAHLHVDLNKNSIGATDNISLVEASTVNEFLNYKPTIPLFEEIAKIANSKQFVAPYSLVYNVVDNNEVSKSVNLEGKISGDLSSFDTSSTLENKDYGSYQITTNLVKNDVKSNYFQLNYMPDDTNSTQNFYFDYYEWESDTGTLLSLDDDSTYSMYEALTSFINSELNNSNDESSTEDIFGSISDSLSSYIDFIDGAIWEDLAKEIDTSSITLTTNEDNSSIIATINLSDTDSSLENTSLELTINESSELDLVSLKVNVPKSDDYVVFSFSFEEFTSSSIALRSDSSNYTSCDANISSLVDMLNGTFLSSFELKGTLTTSKQNPGIKVDTIKNSLATSSGDSYMEGKLAAIYDDGEFKYQNSANQLGAARFYLNKKDTDGSDYTSTLNLRMKSATNPDSDADTAIYLNYDDSKYGSTSAMTYKEYSLISSINYLARFATNKNNNQHVLYEQLDKISSILTLLATDEDVKTEIDKEELKNKVIDNIKNLPSIFSYENEEEYYTRKSFSTSSDYNSLGNEFRFKLDLSPLSDSFTDPFIVALNFDSQVENTLFTIRVENLKNDDNYGNFEINILKIADKNSDGSYTINSSANIDNFSINESYVIDLTELALLMEIGINTTEVMKYHFSGSFTAKTSWGLILNKSYSLDFYIEITDEINEEKGVRYVLGYIKVDNSKDDFFSEVFIDHNLVYFKKVSHETSWVFGYRYSTSFQYFVCTDEQFTDDILYYLIVDILGMGDIYSFVEQSTTNSNDTDFLNRIKNFSLSITTTSENISLEFSLTAISGNATINYKDKKINSLTVEMKLASLITISLNASLLTTNAEDSIYTYNENYFGKFIEAFNNNSYTSKLGFRTNHEDKTNIYTPTYGTGKNKDTYWINGYLESSHTY